MPKSVTVEFEDGTTHVYDDVPDNITNEQVQERARGEFDKPITTVGAPTPEETAKKAYEQMSATDRAMGTVSAGLNIAGQVAAHPVARLAEAGLGIGYLGNKISNAIAGRGAVPGPVPPTAPAPAPAPTTFTGGANPAFDQALSKPYQATTPGVVKPGSVLDNATQMVRKLALNKILPAAQVGAGLFYTSPEEIATLKAAEARRKALGQP